MIRFFLALLLTFTPLRVAAEFSYEFEMPPFFLRELADKTAHLTVRVDNGYASDAGQNFTNQQITGASLHIDGHSIHFDSAETRGTATYVTTDSKGFPTLTLTADQSTFLKLSSADGLHRLQLATRNGFGPTPFVYRNGGDLGVVLTDDLEVTGIPTGYVAPAEMPAAGGFLIVMGVLVFFGVAMASGERNMPSARSFHS